MLLDEGEHTIALQPDDYGRQSFTHEHLRDGITFRDCVGRFTHFTIDDRPYGWIGGEPITLIVAGNITITFGSVELL